MRLASEPLPLPISLRQMRSNHLHGFGESTRLRECGSPDTRRAKSPHHHGTGPSQNARSIIRPWTFPYKGPCSRFSRHPRTSTKTTSRMMRSISTRTSHHASRRRRRSTSCRQKHTTQAKPWTPAHTHTRTFQEPRLPAKGHTSRTHKSHTHTERSERSRAARTPANARPQPHPDPHSLPDTIYHGCRACSRCSIGALLLDRKTINQLHRRAVGMHTRVDSGS